MGLGVVEDTKLSHIPNTVLLNDEAAYAEAQTANLKHGTGKNSHVVLPPQPSMMMVGVLIGVFATMSYGLDAFRSQSNEMFVMNMLFKNFMFYGLSNFANRWVAAKGSEEIMFVFAGTTLAMCILAIPVYVYGKKLRS